jgi:hypothetical protein
LLGEMKCGGPKRGGIEGSLFQSNGPVPTQSG